MIDQKYQLEIHYDTSFQIIQDDINKYLENLCLDNYSTLQGRQDAIRSRFDYKYNIPIYINKDVVLVKIKDERNTYWINVLKVLKANQLQESMTEIVFLNGKTLNINKNKPTVDNIIERGRTIINKNGLVN